MNSPAHIKGFVGAAGADLKTDEHVHVATDFMGHFLWSLSTVIQCWQHPRFSSCMTIAQAPPP